MCGVEVFWGDFAGGVAKGEQGRCVAVAGSGGFFQPLDGLLLGLLGGVCVIYNDDGIAVLGHGVACGGFTGELCFIPSIFTASSSISTLKGTRFPPKVHEEACLLLEKTLA